MIVVRITKLDACPVACLVGGWPRHRFIIWLDRMTAPFDRSLHSLNHQPHRWNITLNLSVMDFDFDGWVDVLRRGRHQYLSSRLRTPPIPLTMFLDPNPRNKPQLRSFRTSIRRSAKRRVNPADIGGYWRILAAERPARRMRKQTGSPLAGERPSFHRECGRVTVTMARVRGEFRSDRS